MENLKVLEEVKKSDKPLVVNSKVDEFTDTVSKSFDYTFEGKSKFHPYNKPTKIPKEFNIGLIVGSSGSGKSTLLKEFGEEEDIEWDDDLGIISHYENPDDGVDKLSSVGLNSIPSWVRPYRVLSTGEKFRADLSRRIKDNAVIDEFTSVVDRTVAKATSTSISKYIKKNDIKNVVFATCHYDIIEWLEPDWIFDANTGKLYDGRCLRRPKIELKIFSIEKDIWGMFKDHHYLSGYYNSASHAYGVLWNDELVGFTAVLPMPSGTLKNAWRGHRTVILPDYQGMGIGTRVSNAIGEIYINQGLKYYSRSSHPRFTYHRMESDEWLATSKNNVKRKKSEAINCTIRDYDTERVCSSYQYVGSDYFNKEHFRILFNFNEDYDRDYEYFEKYLNQLLQNVKDDKFIILIGGKNKQDDLHSEIYSKQYGLRNELDLTEARIKRGIEKFCDVVVILGTNEELVQECIDKGIEYRVMK